NQDNLLIRQFYMMALRNFEAFLSVERLGVLSIEDVAIHVGGVGRVFGSGYGRSWWEESRHEFPAHLVARVDELIAAREQSPDS
ncbi:MAG: hypothetical protein P8Y69_18030, partial [Gammaproteobacteria bacterium]